MSTDLDGVARINRSLDLRGIIRERLWEIYGLATESLVSRVHADEQKQLAVQKGSLKTTEIFGSIGRYFFALKTKYQGGEIIYQFLFSLDSGDLRAYQIAKAINQSSPRNEVPYTGFLKRGNVTYEGVSPEDGVAEVLLGERRVSNQPH